MVVGSGRLGCRRRQGGAQGAAPPPSSHQPLKQSPPYAHTHVGFSRSMHGTRPLFLGDSQVQITADERLVGWGLGKQ